MSILNSKFDIQSVDNPLAVAALAQVLEVYSVAGASDLYSGTGFEGGTPQTPDADKLLPGTVVTMKDTGEAEKATLPLTFVEGAAGNGKELDAAAVPKMPFVTIDGNTDYSGRFVRKITVFHGGFTMVTDQYTTDASTAQDGSDPQAASFKPGYPVTVVKGKIVPRAGASALRQIYGFVGPAGLDAVNGVLQVIVPQGVGI